MRILIINQAFWPDTSSTSQHITDLACELVLKGNEVTVFTSLYGYDNSSQKFSRSESFNGVNIKRIRNAGFGKKTVIGRLADFASFNLLLFLKLFFIKKRLYDVMVGMTSPPLISYFGVLISRLKKIHFFYWTMDLQPELAIASGMLNEQSLIARFLTYVGNYTIKHSDGIVALDRFMKDHLVGRGADAGKVSVVPVWPVLEQIYNGSRLENPFRKEHGFGEKLVIMYSGNHAYVHPLDTLLEAALKLRQNKDILFVFIGGGVRKKDVTHFKQKHDLENIIQLPYQPRSNIHISLAAADLQVVVMGEGQVGYTHPNKIYGAMFAGKPIIYIGPKVSHVTDIMAELSGNVLVQHGQVNKLVSSILEFWSVSQQEKDEIGRRNLECARTNFEPGILKEKMVRLISTIENQDGGFV